MTHDPNAIEVRYQDKLVGWLDSHREGNKTPHCISLELAPTASWHEVGRAFPEILAGECRAFKIERMSWSIDGPMVASLAENRLRDTIARSVPAYAESFSSPEIAITRYSWSAVKLNTFEDYEWIFDYTGFVPIDGPRDLDTARYDITGPFARDTRDKMSIGSFGGVSADRVWIDEAVSAHEEYLKHWFTRKGIPGREEWSGTKDREVVKSPSSSIPISSSRIDSDADTKITSTIIARIRAKIEADIEKQMSCIITTPLSVELSGFQAAAQRINSGKIRGT